MAASTLAVANRPAPISPEGVLTLYRIPEYQRLFNPLFTPKFVTDARESAIRRFGNKKNRERVFGDVSIPPHEMRDAVSFLLHNAYMHGYTSQQPFGLVDVSANSKAPPGGFNDMLEDRAIDDHQARKQNPMRRRKIFFVISELAKMDDEDLILKVDHDYPIGRIVLPHDEARQLPYIPTPTGHRVFLPLTAMSDREHRDMGRAYRRYGEAILGLNPRLHRDRREHDRTREQFAEAGVKCVAHPNRVRMQQDHCCHRPPPHIRPRQQPALAMLPGGRG